MNLPGELARALGEQIDRRYLAASTAADHYVAARAAQVLDQLGFWDLPREARRLEELTAALGVLPERTAAFGWILDQAATLPDLISGESAGRRYQPCERPPGDLADRAGESLDAAAMDTVATRDMVDFVAACYPDVLRGSRSGPVVLFKGQGLHLWERYFSAENPLYDVHNQLAARGLGLALDDPPRPMKVVELGTGTGGSTAALLEALAEVPRRSVELLTISDIAPSFLLRVLDKFQDRDWPPLARRRLDFNQPFGAQGVAAGSIDIFVEANALHNASNPLTSLGYIAEALSPEGVLVLSESICGDRTRVHQDFILNLLPMTDEAAGKGSASRFFSASHWHQLLEASDLQGEVGVNPSGPELALLALARKKA